MKLPDYYNHLPFAKMLHGDCFMHAMGRIKGRTVTEHLKTKRYIYSSSFKVPVF
jgi:hypothetical protein